MNTKLIFFSRLFILWQVMTSLHILAEEKNANSQFATAPGQITSPLSRYAILNINNLRAWMREDGLSSHPPAGEHGVVFPQGTAKVVYQDGIVWGGQAYRDPNKTQPAPFGQRIRVGGANYKSGCQPGQIIGYGSTAQPADTSAPEVRIYRIRRDYHQMSQTELRQDAAETFQIKPAEVSDSQIKAILENYERDWKEWPVQIGAPYIDRNRNGMYDPPPAFSPNFTADSLIAGGFDEPGIAGANPDLPADQVIWTVFNDLDTFQSVKFAGSHPLGLEIQVTMWGYDTSDELGNVFFRRIRMINKGGVEIDESGSKGAFWIDSMFVAQWVEPDLGAFYDDLVGCDTLLNMGFAYNGYDSDPEFNHFNLPPPAIGYDILQGPLIESVGDTAIFDFKHLFGRKNLSMTAFWPNWAGDANPHPARTYQHGTLMWYKIFQGFFPVEGPNFYLPFPPNMTPGPFPLAGDPVTGTGHIDGFGQTYSMVPGNREMAISSGPFTMAPADTQEVVIAFVAGLGADRLSSVAVMRHIDRTIQARFNSLFAISPPVFTVNVSYPSDSEATLWIKAAISDPANVNSILGIVKKQSGTKVVDLQLFDDGLHHDDSANDGIYANTVTVNRENSGLFLDAEVKDLLNQTYRWKGVVDYITTAGPVTISDPIIFSDQINNDGLVNPGENIRYGFTIKNQTQWDLPHLRVSSDTEFQPGKMITIDQLDAGADFSFSYAPNNPNTYFSFETPVNYPDSVLNISITLFDGQYNRWNHSVTFMVHPFKVEPETQLLPHTQGPASGTFGIRIVEPPALTGHTYRITIHDPSDLPADRTLHLIDMTASDTLLQNHPFPDELSHNMPVVDGFKLTRGTLKFDYAFDQFIEVAFAGQRVQPPVPIWHQPNSNGSYALSAGGGDASLKRIIQFTEFEKLRDKDLEIRFTDSGGYGFWMFQNEVVGSVSFELWDIGVATPDDTTDDKRLIPILFADKENTVGVFDISTDYTDPVFARHTSDRIYFFDGDYEAFKQDAMDGAISNPNVIGTWLSGRLVIVDLDQDGQIPPPGTTVRITTNKPPSKLDVFEFVPQYTKIDENPTTPAKFELFQNYPNPFNSKTVIKYYLPKNVHVRISIYNILGQEVIRLVDRVEPSGRHVIKWDGTNHAGKKVASGIYIYQLKVDQFVQARKMILVQ